MTFHSDHLSFKLKAEKCPAHECYSYRLMAEHLHVGMASENSNIYIILEFKIANMNSGTKGNQVYRSIFVQCSICTSDTSVGNVFVLAIVSMKTNEKMEEKSKSTQFFHFFLTRFSCWRK
jgi:hypothetical protein